jgi:hypothetical protein
VLVVLYVAFVAIGFRVVCTVLVVLDVALVAIGFRVACP